MSRLAFLNTVRTRITLGAAVLIFGLLAVALSGVAVLRQIENIVVQDLAREAALVRQISRTTTTLAEELRNAERYFSDPSPAVQTAFRDAAQQTHANLHTLTETPGTDETDRVRISRMNQLHALTETWYAYAHLAADVQLPELVQSAASTARTYTEDLNSIANDLHNRIEARSIEQTAMVLQARRNRESTVWLVLASCVIAGLVVAVTTIRSVERPLNRLTAVAKRYATGDLRPAALGSMPRELAVLGDAITDVGTRLRSLVKEVVVQSNAVLSAANDLSAMSEQLAATSSSIAQSMIEISQGARHQVDALDDGQNVVSNLGSGAETHATAATQVSSLAKHIRTLADRHGDDVAAAGTALIDLGGVVHDSANQVEELTHQSHAIEDFVTLIKRVSSQTNLLALNAAIEAARASVGGQGFAVVADEVRQLADSSGDAAATASASIERVRKQVEAVAGTMQQGRQRVAGIESVAQGAASALSEIGVAVQQVNQAANQVEAATAEHLRLIGNLKDTMMDVAREAESHATSSEQVSAAAEEQGASTQEIAARAADLSSAAERLQVLVKGLRV